MSSQKIPLRIRILLSIIGLIARLKCRCKSTCCNSECVNNPDTNTQVEEDV